MNHAEFSGDIVLISVSTALLPKISSDAFAMKIIDDSMLPEIRVNDVLVIDTRALPSPGNYVAVKIDNKSDVLICQYKKLSYSSSDFELITLNDNWPNIKVCDELQVEIIGVVKKILEGFNE